MVDEEMQARFQRQYFKAGWESEDVYDTFIHCLRAEDFLD